MVQMDLLERIKLLSEKRSITISHLEDELGIPNNTIYQWKKRIPNVERLQKVADYFDVSVDYLLDREEKTSLADKYGAFAFDGEPISDEEMEFLLSVLNAKRKAEKK